MHDFEDYGCRRVRIEDLGSGLGCQSVQDLHCYGQGHAFMQSHNAEELEIEYVETILGRVGYSNLFEKGLTEDADGDGLDLLEEG